MHVSVTEFPQLLPRRFWGDVQVVYRFKSLAGVHHPGLGFNPRYRTTLSHELSVSVTLTGSRIYCNTVVRVYRAAWYVTRQIRYEV